MFIIKCSDDGGYCVLENHEVICDENTVNEGDSVSFFWRSKELTGIVISYSGKFIYENFHMKIKIFALIAYLYMYVYLFMYVLHKMQGEN